MTTTPDATPGQLAAFDQARAPLDRFIDDMIGTYRSMRAEDVTVREIDIAALSAWLQGTDHDRGTLAELLAVAVVRLAEEGMPDAR